MSFNTVNRIMTSCVFISYLLLPSVSDAESNQKQSLAKLLKSTIESNGPTAAQQKFKEIYPQHKNEYIIDPQAIMQLISEYANSGNLEAAQALGEIFSTVSQDMVQEKMAKHPDLKRQIEQQKALTLEKDKVRENNQINSNQKPTEAVQVESIQTRDDLDRFTGLYGDPNKPDPHRQFWVAQSCDGQLVMGATWGDASPWWLKSQTDTQFSYKDSFRTLAIKFTTNADKQVTALSHDLTGMKSPLERVGPLTDDYPKCIKPFQR